jgi:hypothetical protein
MLKKTWGFYCPICHFAEKVRITRTFGILSDAEVKKLDGVEA